MDRKEFIIETVDKLTEDAARALRDILLDERFVPLGMTEADKVGREGFEEKLFDYFEKVELTSGKSFERLAAAYIEALDAVVAPRVAQSHPRLSEGEHVIMIPAARTYYYDTVSSVDVEKPTMSSLREYTCRMMLMYTASLDEKGKEIYSLREDPSLLDPERIMNAMAKEKVTGFSGKKKNRFNLRVRFTVDRCIFIMAYMMLFAIKDRL